MVSNKLYDVERFDPMNLDWQLDDEIGDDSDKWADEEAQKAMEFPTKPIYDDEEGLDYTPKRNPFLCDEEIDEAENIYWALCNGLMVNTGYMGSGKDTWLFWLAYKLRRYFGKQILLDIPPNSLFDKATNFIWHEKPYIPFSLAILQRELSTIRAQVRKEIQKDITWQDAFDRWMSRTGKHYLTNSFTGLSEMWKWGKKSRSTTNAVEVIECLTKEFRHYGILICGNAPTFGELVVNVVQKPCTHHVKCRMMTPNRRPNTIRATVNYIRCLTTDGVYDVASKPTTVYIDGLKPRSWLGGDENDYVWNLFNSVNKGTMFV